MLSELAAEGGLAGADVAGDGDVFGGGLLHGARKFVKVGRARPQQPTYQLKPKRASICTTAPLTSEELTTSESTPLAKR